MTDKFVIEENIGTDGRLVLQLPPDAPRGRIRITLEAVESVTNPQLSPEEEAVLDAEIEVLLTPENLHGQGQTAAKIAAAPEIGIWKNREDIVDSVEFVESMRRQSQRERLSRD